MLKVQIFRGMTLVYIAADIGCFFITRVVFRNILLINAKILGKPINESTVRSIKKQYLRELDHSPDTILTELPKNKTRRPLLLRKYDEEVLNYVMFRPSTYVLEFSFLNIFNISTCFNCQSSIQHYYNLQQSSTF